LIPGDEERSKLERRVEAGDRTGVHEYLIITPRLERQLGATCRRIHELLVTRLQPASSGTVYITFTVTDSAIPNTRTEYSTVAKSLRYVLQQNEQTINLMQ